MIHDTLKLEIGAFAKERGVLRRGQLGGPKRRGQCLNLVSSQRSYGTIFTRIIVLYAT